METAHKSAQFVTDCGGSGEVCGVPVELLRSDESIGSLDLSCRGLRPIGARLLALLLPGATSIYKLE